MIILDLEKRVYFQLNITIPTDSKILPHIHESLPKSKATRIFLIYQGLVFPSFLRFFLGIILNIKYERFCKTGNRKMFIYERTLKEHLLLLWLQNQCQNT